jgi:hypothetical protein
MAHAQEMPRNPRHLLLAKVPVLEKGPQHRMVSMLKGRKPDLHLSCPGAVHVILGIPP